MTFRSDLAALGPTATTKDPRYMPLVVQHVRAGNYALKWAPITSQIPAKGNAPAHTATFYVMTDALTIEGVRVVVDAWTHQVLCDLIGCSMMTAKVADLRWFQRAATLAAVLLVQVPADLQHNTDIATVLRHSKRIDDEIAALPAGANRAGIFADVGKMWILRDGRPNEVGLTQTPSKGINYGVYAANASYACITSEAGKPCRVFQSPGSKHPARGEPDYSQIFLAMMLECVVDGVPRDLLDVFTDPELAPLVTDEGIVKVVRQPLVPAPSGPALAFPSNPIEKCDGSVSLGRMVGALPWSGALPDGADAWAQSIVNNPIGTIARDTVSGVALVGRVECRRDATSTWTRGVIFYAPGKLDARGQLVASAKPLGWPGS